ncbi:hypothetical protein [Wolbachia endosymbiont of Brugia pahangi]|uniref:hypothetical protein n=1 Tax=Wolbachia endosymbiont of Brugia pahangi TaxID=96495 RepID=UPI001435DD04|nr:hypothetical protein [Wolbachia endosymbiont of Brugia pahangi]QIT36086.1 hypothetical protein WBP_0263 [Wolbachia endosymbiont of Brugia pahangi]
MAPKTREEAFKVLGLLESASIEETKRHITNLHWNGTIINSKAKSKKRKTKQWKRLRK